MKINSRLTHSFCEIKVDEIAVTIFKSDLKEVEEMINNLLDVANDLARFTNKTVSDFVEECGF